MALIRVPQQSARDIEAWEAEALADPIVASTQAHQRKVTRSVEALLKFASGGPCYCGVSWGKDSVCVAHMIGALKLSIPLVSIVGQPVDNPHNALVRDAFLRQHDVDYHEIEAWCRPTSDGQWHATGTLERGFAEARKRFGDRHVSGVRAAESGVRKIRMRTHGISSANTCATVGWWSGADVYAYLHMHDLPIHPSYAMSVGGGIARERLRVAWLTLRHGLGGREDWEERYYGWRLREIEALARSSPSRP
jgi:phosphoadenosine phosphosulfate reductase